MSVPLQDATIVSRVMQVGNMAVDCRGPLDILPFNGPLPNDAWHLPLLLQTDEDFWVTQLQPEDTFVSLGAFSAASPAEGQMETEEQH